MKHPKHMTNAIIYTLLPCNLKCPRCFMRVAPIPKGWTLTWEEYIQTLDRIKEEGLQFNNIAFTGGESTLWPHLRRAISVLKDRKMCKSVSVITNAVDRNVLDYDRADYIRVTNYGAVNRLDIARLQGQIKRLPKPRPVLRNQYVVHCVWPFLEPQDTGPGPADCGCNAVVFQGNKVFACGMGVVFEDSLQTTLDKPFGQWLREQVPVNQDICDRCPSNRPLRAKATPGLTLEWGLWDSHISRIWTLPWNGDWLRKLYRRYIFSGRGDGK